MSYPFVKPNLHVVLIHFPIAFLLFGSFLELFTLVVKRQNLREMGRWMLLFGAVLAIPAAFAGVYGFRNVALAPDAQSWHELVHISSVFQDPASWHSLYWHVILQIVAVGLISVAVFTWLACGECSRRRLYLPALLLLLLGVATMLGGAWFGGEAIYVHGVGVTATTLSRDSSGIGSDQSDPANDDQTRAEKLFPPMEQHVIFAGSTIGFTLLSMSLSFRRLNTSLPNSPLVKPLAVPATHVWALTVLIAAATGCLGYFALARDAGAFESAKSHWGKIPGLIWEQIKPADSAERRRFIHAVAGALMVLFPIVMAVLSRILSVSRKLLISFAILLCLVTATQILEGTLLLFDGVHGPMFRLSAAAE